MKINWNPPKDWIKIRTIDAHAAGEPLRVIIDGFPEVKGNSILKKRRYIKENYDCLRKRLMWEPRGHSDMYGALITEPEKSDSDLGVIFMHNEGYSTMCGHGIIALTKVIVETGIVIKKEKCPILNIDTPAGTVSAKVYLKKGKVHSVSFINVPSFVFKSAQKIKIDGIGEIKYNIAFGGAFYVFCDAKQAGINIIPEDFSQIIDKGKKIKKAVENKTKIEHPFKQELGFLYGTIFIGEPEKPQNHSRNVCVFADGEVDRSPTGTGVSARAAIHYFKNELSKNQKISIESILGTIFEVKIKEVKQYGKQKAVIPEVSGKAFITGENIFYFDPDDPLKNGFFLR